jgi:hypothetical protein
MFFAWFSLCVVTCGSMAAQPTSTVKPPLKVNGPPDWVHALKSGDRQALKRYYEEHKGKGPLYKPLFGLGRAQMNMDLPRVLHIAGRCERKQPDAADKRAMLGSFLCNEIARSAALAVGDGHAFFSSAGFAQRSLLPAISGMMGRELGFGNYLDGMDASKLAHSTPAPSEHWHGTRKSIKAVDSAADNGPGVPPKVPLGINGVSVAAKLGLSMGFGSPIAVVMREGESAQGYAKFHLKRLVDPLAGLQVHSSQRGSEHGTFGVALAHTVRLGPLEMHDLAVEVYHSNKVPPGVYIGEPLLSRFGGVAIGRRHVELSRKPLDRCAGGPRMTFVSGIREDGALTFNARLGGKLVKAVWKPDVEVLAIADPAALRKATGQGTSGFSTAKQTHRAQLAVRVGDAALHPHAVHTPRSWHKPYQLEIGGPSLKDHVVHLDFAKKRPRITFCRN